MRALRCGFHHSYLYSLFHNGDWNSVHLQERVAGAFRGPDFERYVALPGDLKFDLIVVNEATDGLNLLFARTVQTFRNPQNGNQVENRALFVFREALIRNVRRRWHRFPMVTAELRDQRSLAFREARQIGIRDNIRGMLVVPGGSNEVSHIMQECRGFEQFGMLRRETMHVLECIEERVSQCGHFASAMHGERILASHVLHYAQLVP